MKKKFLLGAGAAALAVTCLASCSMSTSEIKDATAEQVATIFESQTVNKATSAATYKESGPVEHVSNSCLAFTQDGSKVKLYNYYTNQTIVADIEAEYDDYDTISISNYTFVDLIKINSDGTYTHKVFDPKGNVAFNLTNKEADVYISYDYTYQYSLSELTQVYCFTIVNDNATTNNILKYYSKQIRKFDGTQTIEFTSTNPIENVDYPVKDETVFQAGDYYITSGMSGGYCLYNKDGKLKDSFIFPDDPYSVSVGSKTLFQWKELATKSDYDVIIDGKAYKIYSKMVDFENGKLKDVDVDYLLTSSARATGVASFRMIKDGVALDAYYTGIIDEDFNITCKTTVSKVLENGYYSSTTQTLYDSQMNELVDFDDNANVSFKKSGVIYAYEYNDNYAYIYNSNTGSLLGKYLIDDISFYNDWYFSVENVKGDTGLETEYYKIVDGTITKLDDETERYKVSYNSGSSYYKYYSVEQLENGNYKLTYDFYGKKVSFYSTSSYGSLSPISGNSTAAKITGLNDYYFAISNAYSDENCTLSNMISGVKVTYAKSFTTSYYY